MCTLKKGSVQILWHPCPVLKPRQDAAGVAAAAAAPTQIANFNWRAESRCKHRTWGAQCSCMHKKTTLQTGSLNNRMFSLCFWLNVSFFFKTCCVVMAKRKTKFRLIQSQKCDFPSPFVIFVQLYRLRSLTFPVFLMRTSSLLLPRLKPLKRRNWAERCPPHRLRLPPAHPATPLCQRQAGMNEAQLWKVKGPVRKV